MQQYQSAGRRHERRRANSTSPWTRERSVIQQYPEVNQNFDHIGGVVEICKVALIYEVQAVIGCGKHGDS
jgi:hypothetical protein